MRVPPVAKEPSRRTGRNRDVEGRKPAGQAFAGRLEIGFLPRPAGEERGAELRGLLRYRKNRFLLGLRKKSAGHREVVHRTIPPLDIDTDPPPPCDGEQSQLPGMRHIEFQIDSGVLDPGLPVLAVCEGDLFRLAIQIPGENPASPGPGGGARQGNVPQVNRPGLYRRQLDGEHGAVKVTPLSFRDARSTPSGATSPARFIGGTTRAVARRS